MVGIVTLNPCIDKTLFFNKLPSSGICISKKMYIQAGGKGINVARILNSCHVEYKVFSMTAGETGNHFKNLMQKDNICAQYIDVPGLTRTYTTLLDDDFNQIALKETGPQITLEEAEKIKTAFYAFIDSNDISFLCLSDTIACPSLTNFYATAVEYAVNNNIPVLVDMDNEALSLALEKGPDIIKPNSEEYTAITGKDFTSADYKPALRELSKKGIKHPIISLGKEGAVFIADEKAFHGKIDDVNYVSAVGCGDSFIGGLIYGNENALPWKECLKWAIAAGAANCEKWQAARLNFDDIKNKLGKVTFTEI